MKKYTISPDHSFWWQPCLRIRRYWTNSMIDSRGLRRAKSHSLKHTRIMVSSWNSSMSLYFSINIFNWFTCCRNRTPTLPSSSNSCCLTGRTSLTMHTSTNPSPRMRPLLISKQTLATLFKTYASICHSWERKVSRWTLASYDRPNNFCQKWQALSSSWIAIHSWSIWSKSMSATRNFAWLSCSSSRIASRYLVVFRSLKR